MRNTKNQSQWLTGSWLLASFLPFVSIVVVGCAARQMVEPEFPERLQGIRSVRLAPAKAAMYLEHGKRQPHLFAGTYGGELSNTIRRQFGAIRKITLKDLDPSQNQAAAREIESLTFWEAKDLYYYRRKVPPCVPKPLLSLREATDADALLLAYAISLDKTPETQRSDTIFGPLAYLYPPSAVFMIPMTIISGGRAASRVFGSGTTAFQICLVDPKNGDVLWSYFGEFSGRGHLSDPPQMEAMVSEALKSFKTAFGDSE